MSAIHGTLDSDQHSTVAETSHNDYYCLAFPRSCQGMVWFTDYWLASSHHDRSHYQKMILHFRQGSRGELEPQTLLCQRQNRPRTFVRWGSDNWPGCPRLDCHEARPP